MFEVFGDRMDSLQGVNGPVNSDRRAEMNETLGNPLGGREPGKVPEMSTAVTEGLSWVSANSKNGE